MKRARKEGSCLLLYRAQSCSICHRYYSLAPSAQLVSPEKRFTLREKRKSDGYWQDPKAVREYFESHAERFGVTKPSDWYNVTRKELLAAGGGSRMFALYGTYLRALKVAYPECTWEQAKIVEAGGRAPSGYWSDEDHLYAAVDQAAQKLGIEKPEDWYSVPLSDLHEVGFPRLVNRVKLVELLSRRHPDFNWDRVLLLKGKYAQQKRLERAVARFFPETEMIINARKEVGLVNPDTKEHMEVDVYLPSLNLGFEYQEKHHFVASQHNYTPMETITSRDNLKKKLAKDQGLTLISVPCWWDGRPESLLATIKKARPDLLPTLSAEGAVPIPEDMPPNFVNENVPVIEDIGQPIAACFLSSVNLDPTNWWLFEKYDGVRGFWNPLKKAFYSRAGKVFSFPEEIIDAMPGDMFLDGELWFGRERFQEAIKISMRVDHPLIDWASFKFMVFDIPTHKGTYQERYEALEEYLRQHPCKYVHLAEKEVVKDSTHLEEAFQSIIDKGGEGIILRDPLGRLEPGRSSGYLKHKKFRDAEARIVAEAGTYQYECELPNGVRFVAPVGTMEFIRKWNPKPGDIVSFKHRGFLLMSSKPRLPTLYRIRKDLTWHDVVQNFKDQKTLPRAFPIRRQRQTRPKGYWKDVGNRQKYFTEYARIMNFDPYVPENWKKVHLAHILATMGKGPFANVYRLSDALHEAFPDMNVELPEYKVARYHWKNIGNCKAVFDEYAQEKNFNPLDVEQWYNVDLVDLSKKKGVPSIVAHQGGLKAAIQKCYPNLKFEKWKIDYRPSKWTDIGICRKFFDEFAKEEGFDPLDVDAWYSVKTEKLFAKRGGARVGQHQGGLRRALTRAYPELQFSKWVGYLAAQDKSTAAHKNQVLTHK